VLPNSTNQLRLALTTHQVMAYSNGQFLSLPSSRRFDEVLNIGRGAISTIQGQNGAKKQNSFLRRLGLDAPGVSFIIDNAWVRIFVCRWDEALKTNQDFFRYADIEFQRRFHLSPKQWLLVPDQLRPAGDTVWCAYQREHLTALEALSQSSGLRIESVLPTIIAEIAAAEFEAESSPAIYVSAGEQSQNACWMNNDRIRDIVFLNNRVEDRGLVDVFVERQNITPPKVTCVIRPQGTRPEVLRTLVVGETLKTVESTIQQLNDLAIKEQVPA
jgi:hypothetical protein